MKKSWSYKDIELLKKIYHKYSKEKIIELLSSNTSRSWDAIQKQASRLKLKRNEKSFEITKDDFDKIFSNPDYFIPEIAKKYSVSRDSIKRKIKKLLNLYLIK